MEFCKLAASRVHRDSTVEETAIGSYWRGLVRKDNILFAPEPAADFLFAFSVTSVRIDLMCSANSYSVRENVYQIREGNSIKIVFIAMLHTAN